MENLMNRDGYAAMLPCATSASATLEVRGAAARVLDDVRTAAIARTWVATNGVKRAAFAPTHAQGSPAWSPTL